MCFRCFVRSIVGPNVELLIVMQDAVHIIGASCRMSRVVSAYASEILSGKVTVEERRTSCGSRIDRRPTNGREPHR